MATTTNYSWTTPDDTALVKDGAAAIRSLGTAIDSTVFTNAGNAIAKTIVDAKGDIIAATAADTVSRLASSGVNNDVLTVDTSTATGLKWAAPAAGGMTLISTTTLTGASITLSSIPQTYNHLVLMVKNFKPATDGANFWIRVNGDATNSRYSNHTYHTNTAGAALAFATSRWIADANDNSVDYGFAIYTMYNYTDTTAWKLADGRWLSVDPTTTTQQRFVATNHTYNQLAAITSLVLLCDTGNFTSGTALLYGVK